jgi:ferredoxin
VTRRTVQLFFLILTVTGVFLLGANAERWCPFGGVEAIYTYINEGNLTCSLAVSNFYILGAVLLSALLLRRVFCGYACPIGAVSEWLQKGAHRLGIKPARVPRGLDHFLSLLKYPILAVILYFTWTAGELIFRGFDPCYALLSRHGEDITFWAYVTAGGIVLFSLFITVPFCRWLCPLAAVLNPFSRFGAAKVMRNEEPCTSCRKCAKACPMAIPVDRVKTVNHARCTSCLDCVDACPEQENSALQWRLAAVPQRWSRAALVVILLGIMTAAVSASYLFPLPSFMWSRGEASGASVTLRVEGLNCRGSANMLVYFLKRDDELEIPGPLRLEAWPEPGPAKAVITFDPAQADEDLIRMAVTEAYYDYDAGIWRASPFKISGYDPLGL